MISLNIVKQSMQLGIFRVSSNPNPIHLCNSSIVNEIVLSYKVNIQQEKQLVFFSSHMYLHKMAFLLR